MLPSSLLIACVHCARKKQIPAGIGWCSRQRIASIPRASPTPTRRLPPTAHHLAAVAPRPIARCPLGTAHCPLFTARCPLFTACCPPPVTLPHQRRHHGH